MADEVTTTKKSAPKLVEGPKTVEDTKPEQDVLIPVDTSVAEAKGEDHVANINKALDAAKEAMIASGMAEGDADAYLNAARPSGVSTATGNYADLQRMTGLPTVQVADADDSRLKFAHKLDKDAPVVEPTEERAAELKASADANAAAEKKDK